MQDQISIEQIKEIVRSVLPELLGSYHAERKRELDEISLLERILRLEEELKALRILEAERHELLLREIDKRFEAVDKRFEAVFISIRNLQWLIGAGIAVISFLVTAVPFFYRHFLK